MRTDSGYWVLGLALFLLEVGAQAQTAFVQASGADLVLGQTGQVVCLRDQGVATDLLRDPSDPNADWQRNSPDDSWVPVTDGYDESDVASLYPVPSILEETFLGQPNALCDLGGVEAQLSAYALFGADNRVPTSVSGWGGGAPGGDIFSHQGGPQYIRDLLGP